MSVVHSHDLYSLRHISSQKDLVAVRRFGSLLSHSATCNSVAPKKPRWSFSTAVQMCMFTLNTALSSMEAPQHAADQSEMPGAGRTECCG